ncbi:MAG: EAL domain-containing protein (putative c-di-GMP-specific phosphodiesterase class I), partial [Gammaproteobacteria bacterium]
FNCDYAQGFLFSKPVPAGEFERLLGSAAFPT